MASTSPQIEVLNQQFDSSFKNFLKVAPLYLNDSINVKEIELVLKDNEIQEFEYLASKVISRSLTIDEALLKIRGGDFFSEMLGVMLFIAFMQYMNNQFQIADASFVPPNILQDPMKYWQNIEKCPRQPKVSPSNPICRKPGFESVVLNINPESQSIPEDQSQYENVPTKSQIKTFNKNGVVDLRRAFNEVERRACLIGNPDFECSFERFKELATEAGKTNFRTTREAIIILHGEMLGHYKDAHRINYGEGVKGPDDGVTGLGQFSHITHAETKNAVGSAIEYAEGYENPNVYRQGKSIGKKSRWQKEFWSNPVNRSRIENIDQTANFPESIYNTLTMVDTIDVPLFEKGKVTAGINKGSRNDTNTVILNNETCYTQFSD